MTNINSAFYNYDETVEKSKTSYSGLLGLAINGNRIVNHPTRAGFVYVRLRDNLSEVVQAFNDKVSPVYDFPVLIQRKGNRWYVLGRDDLRYESWGTSAPYLPRHGDQHSFNRDGGGGGDVVWTYPDQFMPLLVYPSGTYGGSNLLIAPYVLQKADKFIYVGNTGTTNIVQYKPTNSNAIMGLVYLDRETGNPGFLINSGTPFSGAITGTNAIVPYLPFPSSTQEPLYAFRLVSGTSSITWDNLYNVRQFIGGSTSTGTSGGVSDHESLTGLLGGSANNHYHLTPSQVIGLVSGTSTSLHSHASGGGTGISAATQIDQTGGTSDTYGALAGLVNGSNQLYTVSQGIYVSGMLEVYLNGQLQTQGSGQDWVETAPASGTFTFAVAPPTGSEITAIYTYSVAGVAAGNDTEIQFNDGGVLAGNSGLTFNKTTGIVNIASGTYNLAGVPHTHSISTGTSTITGILPPANGGTGILNTGTFTNQSNTTITGGGTIALAGYTLTVPGTGTAMLGAVTDGFIPRSNFGTLTAGTIRDMGGLIGIGMTPTANRGVSISYTGVTGSASTGLAITKVQAVGQVSNGLFINQIMTDGTVGNSVIVVSPTLTTSAAATSQQRIMNFTYTLAGSGGGSGAEGAFADMRYNQTSGTLSGAYGFRSRIRNQNVGTITSAIGHSSDISVTGDGGIGTYAGFSADAIVSHTGAGVITNSIGLNVANQGDTKTTNAYGIKIASQQNATSLNYAIFTASGLNLLGDQLKIDGSADRVQEIVQAHSTQNTNVWELQTSAAAVVNSMSLATGTVFNEQGAAAIDFRIESDTEANMMFLDSSADAVYFGGTTDGVKIAKGGELSLIGTATVWDDLRVAPDVKGTGAKDPSWSAWLSGLYLYDFDNAAAGSEKEIWFNIQMPHGWKEGTSVYPHVHWVNDTAGTAGQVVRWGLEYTVAKIGATFPAVTTVYATTIVGGGDITVADEHLITSFDPITMTGNTISTILVCRLFRNSSNAADTYSGTAGLLSIDWHFEIDKIGSSTEFA